ncbi:MAG TPA: hypothetical protein VN654_18215 [Vicinamibacterales bacterium]|jgi:hypothetical protein|nr:hypothetical protein [Vicinamibacterales bacterium]
MQQRRLRLGDILDDYCPRERRITNHAVVAMIDDEVKQTRCTTCDADHEYKQARIPPPRRKKDTLAPTVPTDMPEQTQEDTQEETQHEAPFVEEVTAEAASVEARAEESIDPPASENGENGENDADADEHVPEDDGPVHRRLIRATLPRPEGQVPERKTPDFTVRQPGGRGGREFDGNRGGGGAGAGGGGQRHGRGRRAGARGPQGTFTGPSRFGGPRQNSPQGGQRQNGNRPGPSGSQRGSGRPQGQQRGPGRKRGR